MTKHNSKNLIWPVILTLALAGCGQKQAANDAPNTETNTEASSSQEVPAVITSISDQAKKAAEAHLVKGSPTVLFFYADWCPACRAFKPTLEEVEAKYAGVKVLKINVDEQKDLTKAVNVSSIPTLFFFNKDGKFVESTTGSPTVDKLTQQFQKVATATADPASASREEQKTSEEAEPAAKKEEKKAEFNTEKH